MNVAPAAPPLRVLFLSSAAKRGGGRRAVWDLMAALRRAGVDVAALVRTRRPGDPPGVHSVRFAFEALLDRLAAATGRDFDLRHVGSILRLARIRRSNADLVHFHVLYGSARAWLSLRSVQRLARRVPTVWTFHDEWPILPGLNVDLHGVVPAERAAALGGTGQPVTRDDPRAQKARRRYLPRLPRPTAIICPSGHLAKLAAEAVQFSGVPIYQVPQALPFLTLPETRLPRTVAREALGLPRDAPLVLMVAENLDEWFKGTALGFAVARQIQTPNVRLVVVGDASPPTLAGMPRTAIHLGYIGDDATLARIYRAADILLMSSLGENFPYVALEALACETPVGAFRVGGLVEIVGQNERGILAAPFDATELAAAIDAVLRDEFRRAAYGARGRHWVEATCDVGRSIEAHLAIYRQAIADFDRPRSATPATGPANRPEGGFAV